MSKWNPLEIKVLYNLLNEYSDRLSNDGCNDLYDEEKLFADLLNSNISDESHKVFSNIDLVNYFKQKIKNVPFESQETPLETNLATIKSFVVVYLTAPKILTI
jgi:hypothetical protein